MQTVRIVRVVEDADLRRVHYWRDRVPKNMKAGEAVLLVNYKKDKVRIIDSARAVHNYYSPDGYEFDVDSLNTQLRAMRLYVTLSSENVDKAFGKEEYEKSA